MKTIKLHDYNNLNECLPIHFGSIGELTDLTQHWMRDKPEGRIFVMFDTWTTPQGVVRKRFLISQLQEDVDHYLAGCVFNITAYPLHVIEFNVFEFVLWEDAFYFCADLQEEL